jgi:transglutaminase-like putative cysteine protease
MNFYSVRHLTRFRYSRPISESIMETRMHPRSDASQHCLNFSLSVSPRCRVFSYRDHLGNNIQHFDIPGEHNQLVIVAESVVEQQSLPDVPEFLAPEAWSELDELIASGDYWEMLLPSTFAVETPAVTLLAEQMGVTRRDDPLMLVLELNQRLFNYFESHAR